MAIKIPNSKHAALIKVWDLWETIIWKFFDVYQTLDFAENIQNLQNKINKLKDEYPENQESIDELNEFIYSMIMMSLGEDRNVFINNLQNAINGIDGFATEKKDLIIRAMKKLLLSDCDLIAKYLEQKKIAAALYSLSGDCKISISPLPVTTEGRLVGLLWGYQVNIPYSRWKEEKNILTVMASEDELNTLKAEIDNALKQQKILQASLNNIKYSNIWQ